MMRHYRDPPNVGFTRPRIDPRNFGRGYKNSIQPDQALLQKLRDLYGDSGMVPMGLVQELLGAANSATSLEQGAYYATLTGPSTPVELIPRNPYRGSLLLGNFWPGVTGLTFSYDYPVQVGKTAGGTPVAAGIPIAAGSPFIENWGGVSANGIWVWSNVVGDPFPFVVIGYEGTPSLMGNNR